MERLFLPWIVVVLMEKAMLRYWSIEKVNMYLNIIKAEKRE